jgi:hypothetical protein
MDRSIFEQVTSALTVKAICSPMGVDIGLHDTLSALQELSLETGTDPFSCPSRVLGSDGSVRGIVWGDDWGIWEGDDPNPLVSEVMEGLEPSQFLSSATTILDAVEIFSSKSTARYFYVIDVNDVVGVIFYEDIFRPLGRLAFLALALEIEDQALSLCQSGSLNQKCWQCISDNRRRKAIELFNNRYKREPILEPDTSDEISKAFSRSRTMSDIGVLIGCTNLVDKATMIWKQKLINPATQADVLGFFNDLKEIRDQCAHPGGAEELIPKQRLAHFVSSAKRMRDSLGEAIKFHGVTTEKRTLPIDLEIPF